jgi:hypothetical protein
VPLKLFYPFASSISHTSSSMKREEGMWVKEPLGPCVNHQLKEEERFLFFIFLIITMFFSILYMSSG